MLEGDTGALFASRPGHFSHFRTAPKSPLSKRLNAAIPKKTHRALFLGQLVMVPSYIGLSVSSFGDQSRRPANESGRKTELWKGALFDRAWGLIIVVYLFRLALRLESAEKASPASANLCKPLRQ